MRVINNIYVNAASNWLIKNEKEEEKESHKVGPRQGANHGSMNHEANVLAYDDWVNNLQQWRMELDKWSGELFNQ
jgi:hypothetical protein